MKKFLLPCLLPLMAIFFPSTAMATDGEGYTIEFWSSDEDRYEATAHQAGTAEISAVYEGNAFFAPSTASNTLMVEDERPVPDLAWSCGENMAYAKGGGVEFVSPTLTVGGEGIEADDVMAVLVYSSSNELVATVSETGLVEVVGVGTAVITATLPEGDPRYAGTSVSFTLRVTSAIAEFYSCVNSIDQMDFSKRFILVNRENSVAMGAYNTTEGCHGAADAVLSADGAVATSPDALAFRLVKFDLGPVGHSAGRSATVVYRMLLDNGRYMLLFAEGTTEVESEESAVLFNLSFIDNQFVRLANVFNDTSFLGYDPEGGYFSSYSDDQCGFVYLYQEDESLSTGIGCIAAESAGPDGEEVEWYTLQGVRVTAPGPGIYIRRCGNKATRLFFK